MMTSRLNGQCGAYDIVCLTPIRSNVDTGTVLCTLLSEISVGNTQSGQARPAYGRLRAATVSPCAFLSSTAK